jgi:signal transduction histidine kinase
MITEQPKKSTSSGDYNFSLKVIIILVSLEVVILVCISFVKIYIDKKHSIIDRMRDEIEIVEKIFVDDTDYSEHVLKQMASLLKYSHGSDDEIENIISQYSPSIMNKRFFGWHGFYWVNKNHIVTHVSGEGNILKGSSLSYLSSLRLSKISPNKIFYSANPDATKKMTSYLDMTLGVCDENGKYVGALILQMDVSSIISNLEIYRRNNITDFAIIDSRMNLVMTYPLNKTNLGLKGKTVSLEYLLEEITHINFFSKKPKEISNLDIFSGSNFLARKLKDKPYLILVSQDPEFIKLTFTKKIALKFLEIIVLASFFLAIVLMVYKRETWLRGKAEKASKIATKAMIAKSDFLSYTAHEVRSPLGFILTGSEIMVKKLFGPMPEQYQTYVEGIHHNAKLILDFINDLLEERHVATGNFKLREQICKLPEIITNAINTNKTRFHSRNVAIESHIEQNLPFIMADERRVLQMLTNLISNSYKYSLDNTTIKISAAIAGKRIKISVEDQGIGMSKDEIKIAMSKYGTVHDDYKINNFIESYGLGLPIVLSLCKAHDAKMDIKSEIDKGTKISIFFPENRVLKKDK